MPNYNNNHNDDEIVEPETMSLYDFLIELPVKFILGFFLFLYVFTMGVVLLFLKLIK
jgi:hypothetical protein